MAYEKFKNDMLIVQNGLSVQNGSELHPVSVFIYEH